MNTVFQRCVNYVLKKVCFHNTPLCVNLQTPKTHLIVCYFKDKRCVGKTHHGVFWEHTCFYSDVVYCMLKCLIIACINYHLLSKLARQQYCCVAKFDSKFHKVDSTSIFGSEFRQLATSGKLVQLGGSCDSAITSYIFVTVSVSLFVCLTERQLKNTVAGVPSTRRQRTKF